MNDEGTTDSLEASASGLLRGFPMDGDIIVISLIALLTALLIYAVWYFGRPLLSRILRQRRSDFGGSRPRYPMQTSEGAARVDRAPGSLAALEASLRSSIEDYARLREEVGKLVGQSSHYVEEARHIEQSLNEKHERWATDYANLSGYRQEVQRHLDEALHRQEVAHQRQQEEQIESLDHVTKQIELIEASLEALKEKQVCPWISTLCNAKGVSEGDDDYLVTLAGYLEGLNPGFPKYLSGVEAAVSQLGQYLLRELEGVQPGVRKQILDGVSRWFATLHPGHKLKIPVIGDGLDDRYHKDVSSVASEMGAVRIVEAIENWGLIEVESNRIVLRAEVRCRG